MVYESPESDSAAGEVGGGALARLMSSVRDRAIDRDDSDSSGPIGSAGGAVFDRVVGVPSGGKGVVMNPVAMPPRSRWMLRISSCSAVISPVIWRMSEL